MAITDPLSRIEAYLHQIALGDSEFPIPDEPQSRIEEYLAYIIEHGTGITFEASVVDTDIYPTLEDFLASHGENGKIYLYPNPTEQQPNAHLMYIWVSSKSQYQYLGTTEIDLTDYYTKYESDMRYSKKAEGGVYGNLKAFDEDGNDADSGIAFDKVAKVDGAYDGMSVGYAKNLISPDGIEDTPENDSENNPFIFRTSAGTQSISDGIANIKKIRGKSYKWNQLVQNGNFESTSGWSKAPSSATIAANGNVLTFTTYSSDTNRFYCSMNVPANHKVLFSFDFMGDGRSLSMRYGHAASSSIGSGNNSVLIAGPTIATYTSWTKITTIFARTTNCQYLTVGSLSAASAGTVWRFRNFMCIDLTAIYGLGNEPATVEEFLADFPMFNSYVAYTPGEVTGIKPTNLSTVGFNAFNPATGKANLFGGNEYQITGTYTSLSYSTGETITLDSDGQFTPSANGELTVTGGDETTTCVHLVWSGYRNGEYEPHWHEQIPTYISTYFQNGMHGIGALQDELESNKATKRLGTIKFNDMNLARAEYNGVYFFSAVLADAKLNAKAICGPFEKLDIYNVEDLTDNGFFFSSQTRGTIYIRADDCATVLAFKTKYGEKYLVYELDVTVETEINPPMNFNYRVSDFGTEEWKFDLADTPFSVPADLFYQNNLVDKLRNINDLTTADMDEIMAVID